MFSICQNIELKFGAVEVRADTRKNNLGGQGFVLVFIIQLDEKLHQLNHPVIEPVLKNPDSFRKRPHAQNHPFPEIWRTGREVAKGGFEIVI